MRHGVKAAAMGVSAVNAVIECKLLAERLAGKIIADMQKHSGGRPAKTCDRPSTGFPRIEDLGITRHQSSKWQRIASVPEDIFFAHIKSFNEASREITTASVLKLAAQQPSKNGSHKKP